jgi:predicted DNA-binding transcriptional regulator YafY
MRVFRLSRMLALSLAGTTFERDSQFDLQKFWFAWCDNFEKNPPAHYAVEIEISSRGRRKLLDAFGQWFRAKLEPLGDRYRGRKRVTLDFDREDIAVRLLFDLAEEVTILNPRGLRGKLHRRAARVAAITANADT